MGTRPYYIINTVIDYDGYASHIDYIGNNWKAAYDRFNVLIDNLKYKEFLDHGIEEQNINIRINRPQNEPLQPGQSIWAYLDDDCEIYISVQLLCMTTNHFKFDDDERIYKQRYPDSKY